VTLGHYLWYSIPETDLEASLVRYAWSRAGGAGFQLSQLPASPSPPTIGGRRLRTIVWRHIEQMGAENIHSGVYFIARRLDESGLDGLQFTWEFNDLITRIAGGDRFHAIEVPDSNSEITYLGARLRDAFIADTDALARELTTMLDRLNQRTRRRPKPVVVQGYYDKIGRAMKRRLKIARVLGAPDPTIEQHLKAVAHLVQDLTDLTGWRPPAHEPAS